MPRAHFLPNSLRIEDTAATHGVYSRMNTSRENAANGVKEDIIAAVLPYSTDNVPTTLSFAMNPAINAVTTLQSPNPSGEKISKGTQPEMQEYFHQNSLPLQS